MRIFVVGRGEDIASVSRKTAVSISELCKVNGLQKYERTAHGQAIVIPENESPKGSIEVGGFAYPETDGGTLNALLPYMTTISPFSHRPTESGELILPDDAGLISRAKEQSVAALITVSNLGDDGGFSGETAHRLCSDKTLRDRFADNVLRCVTEGGRYGANLYFNYIYPYDRDDCSELLRHLSERLHREGKFLYATVAAEADDERECAFDLAALGKYCDRVVIMSCERGGSHAAPQAVSSIADARRVLCDAAAKLPAKKLLMGISNHGYSWRLPWDIGEEAQLLYEDTAVKIAAATGSEIEFDAIVAASHFEYRDPMGAKRSVWFEDVRSLAAKLSLAKELSIAGICLFTLRGFGQNSLYVLKSMFNTEKIV